MIQSKNNGEFKSLAEFLRACSDVMAGKENDKLEKVDCDPDIYFTEGEFAMMCGRAHDMSENIKSESLRRN